VTPIKEHVEVTGPFQASQIPELYSRLDLSIQLHRLTDWYRHITPTKFFESLANGVPVVVSDMGDLRELVETYRCGVVVNEADASSVLQGVEAVLKDPGLRQEMALNGLKLVKEEYNWEVMRGRLLETFEHLLAGPPVL
jgi:glycosyltransferase involved in cell wall biosynthesis